MLCYTTSFGGPAMFLDTLTRNKWWLIVSRHKSSLQIQIKIPHHICAKTLKSHYCCSAVMDIKMKDCSLRPNITSSRLTINAAFTIAHQDFALRGTSHISTTFRNATMLGPELIQVRLIKSGKFCFVCWIHISGTSTWYVYFSLKHNFQLLQAFN